MIPILRVRNHITMGVIVSNARPDRKALKKVRAAGAYVNKISDSAAVLFHLWPTFLFQPPSRPVFTDPQSNTTLTVHIVTKRT